MTKLSLIASCIIFLLSSTKTDHEIYYNNVDNPAWLLRHGGHNATTNDSTFQAGEKISLQFLDAVLKKNSIGGLRLTIYGIPTLKDYAHLNYDNDLSRFHPVVQNIAQKDLGKETVIDCHTINAKAMFALAIELNCMNCVVHDTSVLRLLDCRMILRKRN